MSVIEHSYGFHTHITPDQNRPLLRVRPPNVRSNLAKQSAQNKRHGLLCLSLLGGKRKRHPTLKFMHGCYPRCARPPCDMKNFNTTSAHQHQPGPPNGDVCAPSPTVVDTRSKSIKQGLQKHIGMYIAPPRSRNASMAYSGGGGGGGSLALSTLKKKKKKVLF